LAKGIRVVNLITAEVDDAPKHGIDQTRCATGNALALDPPNRFVNCGMIGTISKQKKFCRCRQQRCLDLGLRVFPVSGESRLDDTLKREPPCANGSLQRPGEAWRLRSKTPGGHVGKLFDQFQNGLGYKMSSAVGFDHGLLRDGVRRRLFLQRVNAIEPLPGKRPGTTFIGRPAKVTVVRRVGEDRLAKSKALDDALGRQWEDVLNDRFDLRFVDPLR